MKPEEPVPRWPKAAILLLHSGIASKPRSHGQVFLYKLFWSKNTCPCVRGHLSSFRLSSLTCWKAGVLAFQQIYEWKLGVRTQGRVSASSSAKKTLGKLVLSAEEHHRAEESLQNTDLTVLCLYWRRVNKSVSWTLFTRGLKCLPEE